MAVKFITLETKAVKAADVDKFLKKCDDESSASSNPFEEGDILIIPDSAKIAEHFWKRVDSEGKPIVGKESGSYPVIVGCKIQRGGEEVKVDEVPLAMFKSKDSYYADADGNRPHIEGLCGSKESFVEVWKKAKTAGKAKYIRKEYRKRNDSFGALHALVAAE